LKDFTNIRFSSITSGIDIPTTVILGRLHCLGRSTAPIKAVIDEASALNYEKTAVKTIIRRPGPAKQRKEGGEPWKKAATRPSRPMDTVVLDETQKKSIIRDIEEYLLPETRAW
jgi:chaperone BCS1